MGVDRWEQEHRSYRPGRPRPAEVAADDLILDVPEEIPVEDAPQLRGRSGKGGLPKPRSSRPRSPTPVEKASS